MKYKLVGHRSLWIKCRWLYYSPHWKSKMAAIAIALHKVQLPPSLEGITA